MKKLLLPYAAYNLWANQQMMDRIKDLPPEVVTKKVRSSFESLFATVLHLWDAENIWWQRIKLVEKPIRPSENFTGNFSALAENLLQQSGQWHGWVSKVQERMLDHEFIYYNSKKEKFRQPVYEVLLHLFNHSTYHRGQLITMMRQMEVEAMPNTDFIAWSRKKTS